MKFSRILTALTAMLILIAAVGCTKDKSGPTGPDSGGNGGGGGGNVQKLSFYEEQLVGTWYRYHSYDGSSRYVVFRADRTACKWEEANGSNLRTDVRSYSDWHIAENTISSTKRMTVIVSGAGLDYEFDYLNDYMYPKGYRSNLKHFPNTDGKSCQ